MKHFHCDFRVQQLNLHKNWLISFLLEKKVKFCRSVLLLDWQHVLTLRGHHQAFIMNQLILESCKYSWDPKQCLQKMNMKGSCPMIYNMFKTHITFKNSLIGSKKRYFF